MTIPTPEPVVSPVAMTRWQRSTDKQAVNCICCEGAHIYGISAYVDGKHFDTDRFVYDAMCQLPEGAQFQIVVKPLDHHLVVSVGDCLLTGACSCGKPFGQITEDQSLDELGRAWEQHVWTEGAA